MDETKRIVVHRRDGLVIVDGNRLPGPALVPGQSFPITVETLADEPFVLLLQGKVYLVSLDPSDRHCRYVAPCQLVPRRANPSRTKAGTTAKAQERLAEETFRRGFQAKIANGNLHGLSEKDALMERRRILRGLARFGCPPSEAWKMLQSLVGLPETSTNEDADEGALLVIFCGWV